VLVVGEGPGRKEDAQGRPFVGSAGKRLDRLLAVAGLRREAIYITNIVKCRPPRNRRPGAGEADACRPYLERQIALLRPRLIIILGGSALKRFLPDESLSSAHGRFFDRGGFTLFPTYHPAAMIYNRGLENVLRADFETVGRKVSEMGLSGSLVPSFADEQESG
jgi:uracil-DNA glycosylase family 4